MLILNALLAGLIFGTGLIISGMANPAKVLGFLNLAGNWDPSLAFVMAGAIAIGAPGFSIARRLKRSVLDAPMQLPTATRIDRRLLVGSALFGAGWGLAGFCPGPALVSTGSGEPKAVLFVVAMLVGMAIFSLLERRSAHRG
ncbi:YeeE/YedE family protein [Paraburkholderia panacisoli]|uniref:YeeE/YedE family protein n=1 Tax=Paraburkholderia panacisoli TaxID=2603818 RepID=A0A5B0H8G6_9BURK|nr:YeeE/YedE family protein [Paraburkholderia panacisoli]KAA1011505.1 YeeE/YedE family protein [Paraburkholderia panacisoli]